MRGRSVGEGTASSEFARNRLDCDESRAQSFFADLFECRFDDPAFEEQLELFNACAAPPSFRTVIPWEWQNMRGYLDVSIIANRLASYRLRIRSESIDALIDIDPNFRRATVRSFNGTRFSAAELSGNGGRMDVDSAVVLKYIEGEKAPRMTAKGRRLTAERIRRLAKEKGVRIIENPPLTETLMNLPVGNFIPEETYQVVAEILMYVSRKDLAKTKETESVHSVPGQE